MLDVKIFLLLFNTHTTKMIDYFGRVSI